MEEGGGDIQESWGDCCRQSGLVSQAPLANRQGWTVPDILSVARARGLTHLPCL